MQENVILADRSKENNLVTFLQSGEGDQHSFSAKLMFSYLKDIPLNVIPEKYKKERTIAKGFSFALAYGGDYNTVARNLNMDLQEAKEGERLYFEAYPDLKAYFEQCHQEVLERHYILINPFTSRKFYIPRLQEYLDRKQTKEIEKVFRDSQNYPIQGSGGDQTKDAIGELYLKIKEENAFSDIKITLCIHDQIVLETTDTFEIVSKWSKILQETMENSGNKMLEFMKIKAVPETMYKWKK